MNFFAHQDQARKTSRKLVFLFALAVLAIIAAIDAMVWWGMGRSLPPEEQLGLLLKSSAAVGGVILLASLFRSASLSVGGGKVASSLGGTRILPGDPDPLHQRLYNVVEEMALAAGLPVPEVYVLENEDGINAFAAGHQPADAAVAVTRGCLEQLNREELQGVIGHEFSHILNGDMRLNIRLMGWLYGILVLAMIGEFLMRSGFYSGHRRSRDNNGASIALIGLVVLVVGYIGLFFGRLIKAAVSRQREFLADASAVQFTRNPQGIANALKKIGGYPAHSYLETPKTEEVSHMLFSPGLPSLAGLFATHPPLEERIRRLDPAFQAPEQAARAASSAAVAGVSALNATAAEDLSQQAQAFSQRAGSLPEHAPAQARTVKKGLLPDLVQAAHQPAQAPALVMALLLDEQEEVRRKQLDVIDLQWNPETRLLVEQLAQALRAKPSTRHLPLLEMAFPQLRRRGPRELQRLQKVLDKLIRMDGRISLREFALATLLQSLIQDSLQPTRKQKHCRLHQRREALTTVLSLLAASGSRNEQEARAAFHSGMSLLFPMNTPEFSLPEQWVDASQQALQQLDCLHPLDKENLLQALYTVVNHDQQIRPEEEEVLHAICASLHCPLPLQPE